MAKYEKTAKDKAFDRERTKLQSQICKLRTEVSNRDAVIESLQTTVQYQAKTVESLHRKIRELETMLKLSDEDKALLFSKEKRNAELLGFMRTLSQFPGGHY